MYGLGHSKFCQLFQLRAYNLLEHMLNTTISLGYNI